MRDGDPLYRPRPEQALTGWFVQQYGTPHYAAHNGFYLVNMMAAKLYTFEHYG